MGYFEGCRNLIGLISINVSLESNFERRGRGALRQVRARVDKKPFSRVQTLFGHLKDLAHRN